MSKEEPVQPIHPAAWVKHTQAAIYGTAPGGLARPPPHLNRSMSISSFATDTSMASTIADSTITSMVNGAGPHHHQFYGGAQHGNYGHYGGMGVVGGVTMTSLPETTTMSQPAQQLDLTTDTDMERIVHAMSAPDSGLDVGERKWLKLTIPRAFIGADVVDWLFHHVEGFVTRSDARKFACKMLKNGYVGLFFFDAMS